jgi:cyclic pyranopterin phosphate synthase
MSRLSHLDEAGRPLMVDVSAKAVTERRARAQGRVRLDAQTLAAVMAGPVAKGDVLRVAELAGIMAAKRTGDLIPLCHPLPLTSVRVEIIPDEADPGLIVTAEAKVSGRTGVEMEALTAVSIACLTLYDMLKSTARDMVIEQIMLVEKEGGASGAWRRETC